MIYSKGLIPEPAGHRVSGSHLVLGRVQAPRNKSARLGGPPIGDQGKTSRCTGWGFGRCAQVTLLPDEQEWVVSPDGVYKLGRCIDRADPVSTRLRDDGAEPNQVVRGMVEWGLPREKEWPTLDSNVNVEPLLPQLEAAGIMRTGTWYGVRELDVEKRIARFAQLIDAKMAIAFACFVDDAHESYDGGAPLGRPEGWEGFSNHMLCADEYDDYGRVLGWSGSWGQLWGAAGRGYGNENFIASVDSIYFTPSTRVRG